MNATDLDTLLRDVEDLRRAVRRNNPFLREVDNRGTFMTVARAMYGGLGFNLYIPAFLCMAVASSFAATLGHPWYIVPSIAVFYAFAANGVGLFVQRPEYFATGWYAFAASLTAIFFLERAPFLWTALVWGGLSFVFGLVGLLGNSRRRGAGSPPGRIPPGRGRDGT
jgi:hypothetical protein